jgi:pilus assembly protein Flp/PilA
MNLLKRLWTEEEGATATEYAIIVAILGVGLIGVFVTFRQQISDFFTGFTDQVTDTE